MYTSFWYDAAICNVHTITNPYSYTTGISKNSLSFLHSLYIYTIIIDTIYRQILQNIQMLFSHLSTVSGAVNAVDLDIAMGHPWNDLDPLEITGQNYNIASCCIGL